MIDQPHTTDAVKDSNGASDSRRPRADALGGVRSSDLMPYTGLRYLSTLFRIMAVILLIVLVAETVAGFAAQGTASLPTVLGEASRLIVLAGVLWGTGDLATLLIDMGHDVRATRIFLHRQIGHPGADVLGGTRGDGADIVADAIDVHRVEPLRHEGPPERAD